MNTINTSSITALIVFDNTSSKGVEKGAPKANLTYCIDNVNSLQFYTMKILTCKPVLRVSMFGKYSRVS